MSGDRNSIDRSAATWPKRPRHRNSARLPDSGPHVGTHQEPAQARAPRRRGASPPEAGHLRLPACRRVLRRRGAGADPDRERPRADRRRARHAHHRRPVHLWHRLDHPGRRVQERRCAAAAAAGRDIRRGGPDHRDRAGPRRRDREPALRVRRGDRRGCLHLPHRTRVRPAAQVLPAGGDRDAHHHHRAVPGTDRRARCGDQPGHPRARSHQPALGALRAGHHRGDRRDPAVLPGLHVHHCRAAGSGRGLRGGICAG